MKPTRVAALTLATLLGALALGVGVRERRATPRPGAAEARLWIGGDVHYGARPPALGALAPVLGSASGIVNLEGPSTAGDASASTEARLVNAASGLRALA